MAKKTKTQNAHKRLATLVELTKQRYEHARRNTGALTWHELPLQMKFALINLVGGSR